MTGLAGALRWFDRLLPGALPLAAFWPVMFGNRPLQESLVMALVLGVPMWAVTLLAAGRRTRFGPNLLVVGTVMLLSHWITGTVPFVTLLIFAILLVVISGLVTWAWWTEEQRAAEERSESQ